MKNLVFLLLLFVRVHAQMPNPILTAFPTLNQTMSIRSLSMGGAGLTSATEGDVFTDNVARTAFSNYFHQVGFTYLPQLKNLFPNNRQMAVVYLASMGEGSALGVRFGYHQFGEMATIDNSGATLNRYNTGEYQLTTSYALKIGEHASVGLGLTCFGNRSIQLLNPVDYSTVDKNSFGVCGGISFYQCWLIGEKKIELGAAINNLGPKQGVSEGSSKRFLPTDLGIAFSYRSQKNEEGVRIGMALEAHKLLVPTPPLYDANGNILKGKNPDRSILNALFSSWSDAPNGFKEELKEIRWGLGLEAGFNEQFFLRSGISLEHQTKGNRKFISFGVGYKAVILDQAWGIDLVYLQGIGSLSSSVFGNRLGLTCYFLMGSFE